jgi:hypothetical protein
MLDSRRSPGHTFWVSSLAETTTGAHCDWSILGSGIFLRVCWLYAAHRHYLLTELQQCNERPRGHAASLLRETKIGRIGSG